MESSRPTINEVMQTVYHTHRYYWCRGGWCACMGCVNWAVQEAGYTEQDWDQWCQDNPPTHKVRYANYTNADISKIDPRI